MQRDHAASPERKIELRSQIGQLAEEHCEASTDRGRDGVLSMRSRRGGAARPSSGQARERLTPAADESNLASHDFSQLEYERAVHDVLGVSPQCRCPRRDSASCVLSCRTRPSTG